MWSFLQAMLGERTKECCRAPFWSPLAVLRWLGCQAVSAGEHVDGRMAMGVCSNPCVSSPLHQCCRWHLRARLVQLGLPGVVRAAQGRLWIAVCWVGAEFCLCVSPFLTLTALVDCAFPPPLGARGEQVPAAPQGQQGTWGAKAGRGQASHTGLCPLSNICLCVKGAEVSAHGWCPRFANRARKASSFSGPSSIWTLGKLFWPKLKLLYPCLWDGERPANPRLSCFSYKNFLDAFMPQGKSGFSVWFI